MKTTDPCGPLTMISGWQMLEIFIKENTMGYSGTGTQCILESHPRVLSK